MNASPMKRQIENKPSQPSSEEREAFYGVVTNFVTFAILIGAIRAGEFVMLCCTNSPKE